MPAFRRWVRNDVRGCGWWVDKWRLWHAFGVETMWTSSVQLGVAAVGYKQSVGWGVSCESGVVGGVVGNNLMFYLVV